MLIHVPSNPSHLLLNLALAVGSMERVPSRLFIPSTSMTCAVYWLFLLGISVELASALQSRYLMHALLQGSQRRRSKEDLVESALSVILEKHERITSFRRDILHYTLACSAYNVGGLLFSSLEKYDMDPYPHFMSPDKDMACYGLFMTDTQKMELLSQGIKFFKFPYEFIKVPGPVKTGHVHLPVTDDLIDESSIEVTLNIHGNNARKSLQSVLVQSIKKLKKGDVLTSDAFHGQDMRILQEITPPFAALSLHMETHLTDVKAKKSCHDILSKAIESQKRYGSLFEDPRHETFLLKSVKGVRNEHLVACGAMLSIVASMDTSVSSVHVTVNDDSDVQDGSMHDPSLSGSPNGPFPIEEVTMTRQIQLVQSKLDVPYNSSYTVGRPYTNIGLMGQDYTVAIFDTALDDYSCFLIDESGTHTPHTYDKDFFELKPIIEMDR